MRGRVYSCGGYILVRKSFKDIHVLGRRLYCLFFIFLPYVLLAMRLYRPVLSHGMNAIQYECNSSLVSMMNY